MDVSASSTLAQEEAKQAMENAKPGPNPNLQAETPTDVYPLEELVGLDLLRVLTVRDWQDKVEAGEDILTNSRFVSGRVRAIVKSDEVRKIKTLKYLLLLVQWYHSLKPAYGQGKKLPSSKELVTAMKGVSEDLREGIRQRFADGKYVVSLLLNSIDPILNLRPLFQPPHQMAFFQPTALHLRPCSHHRQLLN